MEAKEINSMNIEELRTQLSYTRAELKGREEDIVVMQQDVDKVSKDRDQYKQWFLEGQKEKKVLQDKLDALKGIVNAI